jgi:hypothetical protein
LDGLIDSVGQCSDASGDIDNDGDVDEDDYNMLFDLVAECRQ